MKKILIILIVIGFVTTIGVIVGGVYLYKKYSEDLPNHEQLKSYTPMTSTRIYAADGSLISEFSKEKRIFVPINNIPKNLVNAFLAAEDSNFYHHFGIDVVAIFRTSIRNALAVITGNPRVGGASTITQQVVKNFLLTKEKTYQRKIREAILAVRMSKEFSKDYVLELYLNQIYLGSGAYGVAAAAQVYFNKSIDELTIEENALLATLPKAPSKLDPRKNIEKAKFRRDWVIQRMIEENFIEEKEGVLAMQEPIILKEQDINDFGKASFFSDSVKKELSNLYGSDNVFEDGITVMTTLDPKLQEFAQNAFEKGIEDYDKAHGYRGALGKIDVSKDWLDNLQKFTIDKIYKGTWQKAVILSIKNNIAKIGVENNSKGDINFESLLWARKYINDDYLGPKLKEISDILKVGDVILVEKVNEGKYLLQQIPEVNGGLLAMDPNNGRVLAMVGGYVDAPNQFNRVTQAFRQPGSTMKTFAYITALENGMTPASIIMDEEISLDQGYGLPPYEPTNYSGEYYGPTTLRKGLEKSQNITTVRMADQVGLDKVVEMLKRFGVNDDPKKIHSLVLGSTETNLMRLTRAYAMMVNGGKEINPAIIEKIQDRDGLTIYRRDKRHCPNCVFTDLANKNILNIDKISIPNLSDNSKEIIDSATAYQITSMLQGVVERGTGYKATEIGKVIGGKTGTTNNSIDSWFVGFSADLVAAVYVGFDTPKSLGARETGASVALPIFIDFMKNSLKDSPKTPFRIPGNVKFVKIDRDTGKLATPLTPKNKIFFEAFKLYDNVESESEDNDSESFEDGNVNEFESESNLEENSSPAGIY